MTTSNLAMVIYKKQRGELAPLVTAPSYRHSKSKQDRQMQVKQKDLTPGKAHKDPPMFCEPKIRCRKFDLF